MTQTKNQNIIKRPPVVVVMGHIDHGKSTLLDKIRKTSVVEKEAGGITQHISAYEAEVGKENQRITFLDTPGHEAFYNIRKRGSRVADIAVLVVSAEDGVKPQSIEAIECIKRDGLPFIVAINKIDKPNANIDKTKQDLAEQEVLVEGWGGTVPVAMISAKTGENMEEFLELILLQAEILELVGDPKVPAEGFVIETEMDPGKGISASLIIKNGTITKNQFVAAERGFAPVRAMEDFRGKNIAEASFSSPIKISGWSEAPIIGSAFRTFASKAEAENYVNVHKSQPMEAEAEAETKIFFPLVIKADTQGSLEALNHEIRKLNNEKISVKVISSGTGSIGEKDAKAAASSGALIVGFNASLDKNASAIAMRNKIETKTFNIIYELTQWLSQKIREATPQTETEETIGSARVLKIFSKNKDKQVVGGRVESGEIRSGASVKIFRRENMLGQGRIKELQSQKLKTGAVSEGQEFGALLDSKTEIMPGDNISAVTLVRN